MTQRFLWLASAALLFVAGCGFVGDNYRKVANDFVDVLAEINDLLDSVRSARDAERSVAKVEKLAIRVDELTLRIKKLPPATKESGALDKNFTTKRDREHKRLKALQHRLDSDHAIARVLQRPMRQLSRAIFDLDFASFEYNERSFRHSLDASGIRSTPAPEPAHGDAFQMARQTRMRQLAGKYGSNRVAMVRLIDLSPAANRAKLYENIRASAKVQDTSMTISPDELTIYLAPVADLQAAASRVPFGKVTRLDPAARTITVSMKPR
jgi:hypothetical protein